MAKPGSRAVRLEMTPLMDVMFLVLVFFIYCVFDMTVHRGTKVDLPQSSGALEAGERIVITILPDDSLELNGVRRDKADILARISALLRSGTEFPVIVSGDRSSSLGTGISLLSNLKEAGVEHVSFQVDGKAAD